MKNYERLRTEFVNGTEVIHDKSGWRDDMKFLYYLTKVFKFFEENYHFSLINFHKLPNISIARWNSRAILVILACILNPSARETLKSICRFLSYDWAKFWFADQLYHEHDFKTLVEILKHYAKASKLLRSTGSRNHLQLYLQEFIKANTYLLN